MNTQKIGIATAKAMDKIEELEEDGRIEEGSEVGAVVIIVALDSKTPDDAPDRKNLRDVQTATFVFGEPENIYIEQGLIEMARHQYSSTEEEE